MEQRLSLVTLGVADVERARAFYERVGWAPHPGSIEAESVSSRPAGWSSRSETFWGGYSGVFVDLDGHPWEVAHNPHWPVGPDGSVTL